MHFPSLIKRLSFAICLPFRMIALPFVLIGRRVEANRIRVLELAAKAIRGTKCPRCQNTLETLSHSDVQHFGIRFKLPIGSRIISDRVPRFRIICPTCGIEVLFDEKYRSTGLNRSDYVVLPPRSQSDQ